MAPESTPSRWSGGAPSLTVEGRASMVPRGKEQHESGDGQCSSVLAVEVGICLCGTDKEWGARKCESGVGDVAQLSNVLQLCRLWNLRCPHSFPPRRSGWRVRTAGVALAVASKPAPIACAVAERCRALT
eukprot:3677452-Rhodomonas_salina.1